MLGTGPKGLKKAPQLQISIDNHVQPLKMLLFVRYAWSLTAELNLPELSPAPVTGTSALPDVENKQMPNPYPILPLLDAWQRGIRNITVLPYSGYFAERRNATHLVASENTMKDYDGS